MQYLTRFNALLEKFMPMITPFSLLIGVLFAPIFSQLHTLVPWIFALLTFSGSLGSGFRDIKTVLRRPVPLLCMLFLLHVWLPLITRIAGGFLFGDSPYLITGMVLEFSVPTAVVSLIWVSIYRGNSALSLSLVLIDTLLAPFLTPLTLKLLVGSDVAMNPLGMIRDLLLMIALPALCAITLNHRTNGRVKITLSPKLAPFSKLCLMLVVMINSSKVAPFFASMTPILVAVTITMLVLSAGGFLWGAIAARILHLDRQDTVSVTFGGGMRNISAGAVIAAQYFPAEVLFPVMISTAFQQILTALAGWTLRHFIREKCEEPSDN